MGGTAGFDQLWSALDWQEIAGCPGRYRLRDRDCRMAPEALADTGAKVQEYDIPSCRDAVLVMELPDGSLISYKRSNGTYVHTLNTPDGFARKLKVLGLR